MIHRPITPDPFEELINSIISQQISKKAAATVSGRVYDLLDYNISPEAVADVGAKAIRKCGMSDRKAGYIMGIAEAALTGAVDFKNLHSLSDAEVIRQLTTLKGVGIWTAEMLLLFSLQRPDIVSYGDLAIRRGMMALYELDELPRAVFRQYAEKYSPYGSVASFYIWALAGQ
ncbi:MAG: DNA-3-methyladenine glycosylase 2 family protein [Firmicutes bacterium]|nr:DNA-3-methyladenine glycosylase 2 family protein [Bacillota bacterium]